VTDLAQDRTEMICKHHEHNIFRLPMIARSIMGDFRTIPAKIAPASTNCSGVT